MFEINCLVANPDKFQAMFLGRNYLNSPNEKQVVKVMDISIKPSNLVKLLGITLDKDLTFKEHIQHLCEATSRNLTRIRNFLNINAVMYSIMHISSLNFLTVLFDGCLVKHNNLMKFKKFRNGL